jgi:hypothetical protein
VSTPIVEIIEVLTRPVALDLSGPRVARVRVRVVGSDPTGQPVPSEALGVEGETERVVRFGWEVRVGKRISLTADEAREILADAA